MGKYHTKATHIIYYSDIAGTYGNTKTVLLLKNFLENDCEQLCWWSRVGLSHYWCGHCNATWAL